MIRNSYTELFFPQFFKDVVTINPTGGRLLLENCGCSVGFGFLKFDGIIGTTSHSWTRESRRIVLSARDYRVVLHAQN